MSTKVLLARVEELAIQNESLRQEVIALDRAGQLVTNMYNDAQDQIRAQAERIEELENSHREMVDINARLHERVNHNLEADVRAINMDLAGARQRNEILSNARKETANLLLSLGVRDKILGEISARLPDQKINQIKLVRLIFDLGLKDAKDMVEAFHDKAPSPPTQKSNPAPAVDVH
jgi:ribosomal protein L7/L12